MNREPGTGTSLRARWQHFNHGSDIGIRGIGHSMEEAFEQAALGLTAVICDPDAVHPRQVIEVSCENPDPELLFVDWIDAVVYQITTRQMLFSHFEVRIAGNRLTAELYGEPIHREHHQPAVEVKGATLTELAVIHSNNGRWRAQCVVDV
ncbi:MAG: archease [Ectothiorhodospiraceae bacterium]|nr:archease [Ectothiorhodospiraceae bacterium]